MVARSKCYLKLGDPQKALEDAEAALSEDKEFNKVLIQNLNTFDDVAKHYFIDLELSL